MGHGIYIASRTRHASRWRSLRASGVPIISTWIYESGEGETSDWAELWERCVREASSCRGLILFAEPPEDDCLSGALVEVGVALGGWRAGVCCWRVEVDTKVCEASFGEEMFDC